MTTLPRPGRAVFAVACALLAGCGDSPNDPTPNDSDDAAAIELSAAPDASSSGEPTTLTVRVLDDEEAPIARAALTLEPLHGSVADSEIVTGDDGSASIVWLLADVDARQVLRVRSGDATLDVAVTSRPRVASLAIQGLAATLALGDTTPAIVVAGQTVTGRAVTVTQPVTIQLADEARRWMDMPVAGVSGRRVVALGPGTVAVRAAAGGLVSGPVALEVPAVPIIRALAPAEVPAAGGVVVIDGYDLDLVAAADVLLDGTAASIADADDSSIHVTGGIL